VRFARRWCGNKRVLTAGVGNVCGVQRSRVRGGEAYVRVGRRVPVCYIGRWAAVQES